MKPSKIFEILDMTLRARQANTVFNPLFVGPPGVGKSQIVQAWARSKNLPFVDLRVAFLESPDFIGFPSITVRDGRQITTHNLPEFWPTEGEGVLLLEEPNRGTQSVMNCLMQLLTDRKVHNYTLPEGWVIVGCINPEGEQYDVNTMDAALRDRFTMFEVTYDKPTFVSYMQSAKWHQDVVNFVDSGIWVYSPPETVGDTPGTKYVSPRTLSYLNAALVAGMGDKENELTVYESILGRNVGKDFYNFRHNESPVMYNDLVKNKKAALKKLEKFSDPNNYKNGMISLTVRDIIDYGDIKDDLLIDVVLTIPVEQGTALIRDLEFKRKDNTLLSKLCSANTEIKKRFQAVLNYGK